MDIEKAYLQCAVDNFQAIKKQGDRVLSQLTYEELCWIPHEEANSIAILVKHLYGNMRSRWTSFLTTDGEKKDRNRDDEFEGGYASKEELLRAWEEGWLFVFRAMETITVNDVLKTVYIRREPHTVMQAIERQVAHYASHIGQLIYIGKLLKEKEWTCLSIPRGKSNQFLEK
ncbi:DUF1572 family protein [Bacillus sp. BP-3]|uniref:DUF1572 family protein n=1 Tax=Bacillus sp. BP-3 TaxID=3022773 RepID=UPI00232F5D31|nr:DUF1572 family protein [Bacillus sp. BP-3]MDC2867086.1 DUF1572 family protein [Bacillus sp. BP-3]